MAEEAKHEWIKGKWSCSTNEEVWDCFEQFDTEEEAIQHGITHCEEMGEEFDTLYWTGRIDPLDAETLGKAGVSAAHIVEEMDSWMFDNLGEVSEGNEVEATKEQLAELDQLLAQVTCAWLTKHKLVPVLCSLDATRSHIYKRCEVHDFSVGPEGSRCTRGDGHDGAHDYEKW